MNSSELSIPADSLSLSKKNADWQREAVCDKIQPPHPKVGVPEREGDAGNNALRRQEANNGGCEEGGGE